MADAGPPGFQLGQGVAGHHPVQLGVTEAAAGILVGGDQQLGADVRPVEDGGQGDGLLRPDAVPQGLVERHRRHQVSGSMNSRIVPPQVRPTANASSSE